MEKENIYSRTEILIGKENLEKIKKACVIIVGLGGVGGYAFEALVRVGVGEFVIIDDDKINITNLNRQIIATTNNIGQYKVKEYKKRAENINSDIKIKEYRKKLTKENISELIGEFINKENVYIIDAIDDINAKFSLISFAIKNNIKIFSSMSTGFKIDSEKIKQSKLKNTNVCVIARKIRKMLRENVKEFTKEEYKNFENLEVVYSEEEKCNLYTKNTQNIPTISYIPAICGLKLAELLIKRIID